MPQRQGKGHKANYICPMLKCKYSSRQFITVQDKITEDNTVSSKHCPIHQNQLVFINSVKVPSTAKEKEIILNQFKK